MKLCVPVRVANGLESCIEPHLPNAEHLLIIDTETRELQHVSLRDQPAEGGEAPRFDAVLCGSIDSATKEALVEKGILAFGTEARTAGEAIAEFEEANLAKSVFQQQKLNWNVSERLFLHVWMAIGPPNIRRMRHALDIVPYIRLYRRPLIYSACDSSLMPVSISTPAKPCIKPMSKSCIVLIWPIAITAQPLNVPMWIS